ncbi:MAG TPA: hypothetical protein ENI51_05405 [Candidatus Atribacteria bacterium]|nr:hypothetical protein [Candidatus Atribacteria bacterium]
MKKKENKREIRIWVCTNCGTKFLKAWVDRRGVLVCPQCGSPSIENVNLHEYEDLRRRLRRGI